MNISVIHKAQIQSWCTRGLLICLWEWHWEAIICSAETLSIGLYLKPEWAVSNSLMFSCSHPVVIKTSCKSVKHILNRQGNVLMCFRSYLVGKKEAKVLLTSWVYCCFLSNVTFLCSLKVVQFMGSKLSSSCHLLFLRKIWSIFTCIVFEWIQWLDAFSKFSIWDNFWKLQ